MTDLLSQHDVLLADLDGTLYAGPAAIPGAVEAVRNAADRGVRTAYITNNASRAPAEVAAHLAELGFPATTDDVVTSSQAAAAMLAGQLPAGLAGAGRGHRRAGRGADRGRAEHSPTAPTRRSPSCRDTARTPAGGCWPRRRSRCAPARCGWPATWTRRCPPSAARCPATDPWWPPLRTATGREPQVAGKPEPALLLDAVRRTGARSALMIGDRLDTDVEGGRAAGMATLLVLTGVSDAAELLAAPAERRPDYVGADLAALTRPADELAPGPAPRLAGRRPTAPGR